MIFLVLVIVFWGSLVGMGVILYRKIPELADLPENPLNLRPYFLSKIKKSIGKFPGVKNINHELYLQKVLSKARVLMLKTERKTGHWLEKLRQKNNQKSSRQTDKYWDELKKSREKD